MMLHKTTAAPLLRSFIRSGIVAFAGNKRLRIYGKLNCASGKRMLIDNRVFFSSEQAATHAGYRPCAHCMRQEYKAWKQQSTNLNETFGL